MVPKKFTLSTLEKEEDSQLQGRNVKCMSFAQ